MTTKLERWTKYTLVALLLSCFAMVTLGGYVRLSGSGLSIPQWPVFSSGYYDKNGELQHTKSVIPPHNEAGWKVLYAVLIEELPQYEGISMETFQRMFWIEWSHRAVGAVITLLYLSFLLLWLRSPEVRRQLGWLPLWGFLVLGGQIILGGLVVLLHLNAVKVAIHLVNAFFFITIILWCLLLLAHPPVPVEKRSPGNPIFRTTAAVIAIVLFQIFSGGVMAGTHAAFQLNTWPKMGETWIPNNLWIPDGGVYHNLAENTIFIQFFHRWFAMFAAAAVIFLVFRCMTVKLSEVARWTLRSLISIVTLQVLLGIATLIMKVHTHLALTHQFLALLLLLALVVVLYASCRQEVVTEEAFEAEASAAAGRGEAANA